MRDRTRAVQAIAVLAAGALLAACSDAPELYAASRST
jgi:hypothetical protein